MKEQPWLFVVGCLPDGQLAPTAPATVLEVSAVFGAARLLDATGVTNERRRPFSSPLCASVGEILARAGTPTTVLASGDPLHHGIAATLLRAVPREAMAVHPAPSAFSLAAAAMRWPLEDVTCASLHSGPTAAIRQYLQGGRRLLLLTRDGRAPAAIAAEMTASGFGESTVSVLGDLGTARATVETTTAANCTGVSQNLNVMAVVCTGAFPPLSHDGCITRPEVRALTVEALSPPGHLWDVGAGSGSVAIAWMARGGSATLFEREPSRLEMIGENLTARGLLAAVRSGDALDALEGAAPPDAVFHGGAVANEPLFDALWARLPKGGRYVANAVTLESETALVTRRARHGGELTRIALSHAAPVGGFLAMKPALPVLQWRVEKRE